MHIPHTISEMIINADSKALATYAQGDLNVVPVSTVRIIDDKIILVNYYMGKTLDNIKQNHKVALTCWKGFQGCQIKGEVDYQDSGELYRDIVSWVKEILPDRTVHGILVIEPKEIFDISATAKKPGLRIA